MSVYKRKTSKGYTKNYHYKFQIGGVLSKGVCKGCTTLREAEEYEKKLKENAFISMNLRTERAVVETFSGLFTGAHQIVRLADAFEESNNCRLKIMPSEKQMSLKRGIWGDFLQFMTVNHPEISSLNDVKKIHAVEYMQYVSSRGRFTARKNSQLSPHTLNVIKLTLREVFTILEDRTGMLQNPFENIPILKERGGKETREAFTEEELQKISNGITRGVKYSEICAPMFLVGLNTGLRKGDVCNLQWEDIIFTEDRGCWLRRKTLKTKCTIELPLLPALKNYLLDIWNKTDVHSGYIFPELARRYKTQSPVLSVQVKKFLKACGIEDLTYLPANRTKAVSKKDFHSCRHTFCYLAGKAGIPLIAVQSVVGHMTPEMTALYSSHTTQKDKQEYFSRLHDILPYPSENVSDGSEKERCDGNAALRDAAHRRIETMSPEELQKFFQVF